MGRNTSIPLNEHFSRFIARQVAGGRYGSASDVVRAGLRLLEEQEAKLDALRTALIEGERAGPPSSSTSGLSRGNSASPGHERRIQNHPEGASDLEDIDRYTVQHWGEGKADAYIRKLA